MNHEPTNRTRTTSVRRGDRRAAGCYEQCVEIPESATHTSVARKVGAIGGMTVAGLVEHASRLDFATLRGLAGGDGLSAFDDPFVHLVDLMAHVRPAADARVVVFESVDGRSVACRLDSLLGDSTIRFELGASGASAGRSTADSSPRPSTSTDRSTDAPAGRSTSPSDRSESDAVSPRRNWRLPVRIDAPRQPAIHDLAVVSIHVAMGDHPFGIGAR